MTTKTNTHSADIADARGAAWGMVANALRYPDRDLLKLLCEPARWVGWPSLLAGVDGEAADRLAAVRSALERFDPTNDDGALAELQACHDRLFGHAVRGACPLYELEYGRGEIIQQASELADIAGFYSAFGLELTRDGHERADHVSVQCEFMSALASREAYAERNDPEAEACLIIRDAQQTFLVDHLGRWLPAFGHRVVEADPDGFYGAVVVFADAFLQSECRRFGVACGSEHLALRPVSAAGDATFTCGLSDAAPDSSGGLVQLNVESSVDTRS